MAPIQAIIFDLGNVLIDFDHLIASSKIAFLTGKTPAEIYNILFSPALIQPFEEGRITPEDFFIHVQQQIGFNIAFEEFASIWNNIFYQTEANKKVYWLLGVLQPHYTLAMLSNINALHYSFLKKSFVVFDRFNYLFTSCEMGLLKPDERIYQVVLSRLNVQPQCVFYTDDRPDMVAAARAMGINGFVYTKIEQLENDLSQCGVPIKP